MVDKASPRNARTASDTNAKAAWNERLNCRVRSVRSDLISHFGILEVEHATYCDMEACIEFFTGIDPEVRRIWMVQVSKPRVVYRREESGNWSAINVATECQALAAICAPKLSEMRCAS